MIGVLFLLGSLRPLSLLREVDIGGCNVGCAVLAHLYHLGLGINPRKGGSRPMDGRGIVDVLYLLKRR